MGAFDKMRKFSRRKLIRIFSFTLALVVVLGGVGIYGFSIAAKYRTQLEYTYERALIDLSGHLNNIDTSLLKGMYTGTAAQANELSISLWSEAGAAKACLAQLPTSSLELDNTNKFLSQVGEYSRALAKKMAEGGKLTDEERKTLQNLSETAASLCTAVGVMRDELSEKRLWVNEVRHAIETQGSDGKAVSTLYEGLTDIEDSFTDYPTLLYDGPFSEHIMQADPLMLKGKTEIDETTAKATAAKMTGVPVEKLQVSDNEDGKMSSFVFEGEGVHAAVTKQGGYCDYFLNSREIGEAAIDYNQAVQKAKEYANGLGLGTFKDSYYMTTEGVCVVNLAYMQGDTVCYTDLIKVGVALDNGQIVSYNARGFLMNHKQRDITAPKYSVEQARQVISPLLTVNSSSLALIPTDAMEEKHCYEFACTSPDGKNILVYVNTDTLQEDNILILLQTDGGTLTL